MEKKSSELVKVLTFVLVMLPLLFVSLVAYIGYFISNIFANVFEILLKKVAYKMKEIARRP